MKVLVFSCICAALVLGLFSCRKSVPVTTITAVETVEADSVPNSQNMTNTASGVVTDETSLNLISIATPQGDTMRFHKGDAVVEGSGIIIGDSAVVYYFFEAVADSANNRPVATKIVTKPSAKKK